MFLEKIKSSRVRRRRALAPPPRFSADAGLTSSLVTEPSETFAKRTRGVLTRTFGGRRGIVAAPRSRRLERASYGA